MIKIFTTNQNGKIEFTEQELLDFIEEIKLECKEREWHRNNPAKPSILPEHPIWTTTPYLAVKPEGSVDNARIREGKDGIFNELLKELSRE
jgi:hypothetical protein